MGLGTHAFPGAADEIAVAFQGDGKTLEVVVNASGVSHAYIESDDEVEAIDSPFDAVYSRLLDLVTRPQWRSHDSFTFSMSTETRPSSAISRSITLVDETTTPTYL